jgi:hypothetical protein
MLNSLLDLLLSWLMPGGRAGGFRIRFYSAEGLLDRPAAEGMISEEKLSLEAEKKNGRGASRIGRSDNVK